MPDLYPLGRAELPGTWSFWFSQAAMWQARLILSAAWLVLKDRCPLDIGAVRHSHGRLGGSHQQITGLANLCTTGLNLCTADLPLIPSAWRVHYKPTDKMSVIIDPNCLAQALAPCYTTVCNVEPHFETAPNILALGHQVLCLMTPFENLRAGRQTHGQR